MSAKSLSMILVLAVVLAGCAGMTGSEKGAVVGGVAGGGAGAIVGGIAVPGFGALPGAAVGAAGGAAIGAALGAETIPPKPKLEPRDKLYPEGHWEYRYEE